MLPVAEDDGCTVQGFSADTQTLWLSGRTKFKKENLIFFLIFF